MFRYKTVKEQLLDEKRENEALRDQVIRKSEEIEELQMALIELAAIIEE